MAGVAPGLAVLHGSVGESVKAKLVGAGVDIVRNSLQRLEVGDLVERVARFFQQGNVRDDAEGLETVANGDHFAVSRLDGVVLRGQLFVELGAGQVVAILAPGGDAALVALEQGRSRTLVHFGNERLFIGAGSGGENLHFHAGLGSVGLGELLPGLVRLGLEVEIVHTAGRGRGFGFRSGFRRGGFGLSRSIRGLGRGSAAGSEAQNHDQSQKNSEKLLHCLFPPNF